MPANTLPISPKAPATSWNAVATLAANLLLDGTGVVETIFTAGVDGARVNRIRIVHRGTNVATVMRFFLNNGLVNTTAANNALVSEITVPANTLSQLATSVMIDTFVNVVLKPGFKINYTIGTAVASGHSVTCPDAGDY